MQYLFSLLITTLFITQTLAQNWQNTDYDWQPLNIQADQQNDLGKYDIVTLLDSTGVDVNENGSGTFTIRKVIKIQTPEGALQNRIIKYDYDPLTAFAEFERVDIYKKNGEILHLDCSKAYDYTAPARAIYWGARQIMISPGLLEPGDIIDYQINKKGFTYALLGVTENEDRFIPPMRGQFYDIVPFWSNEPVMKKIYRVAIPMDKNMQYEFYQGVCNSSVRFEGDKKVLSFIITNSRPFTKEPNMADLFDVAPKLMMSSAPDWKSKSLWFYKVNEDYGSFNATPEAKLKVNELIKGAKTEMEKIAILTHWVADNMRYSGISMGKGEGFTLHNTQMNFTDRCGVCKDKAALLISMLRMAGFEAYPAMTMAGSRVESIPADHFNHSVAVVKLANGKYIPLDPTWVPFIRELWSSAEQQQNYLPGLPEGSDLKITPVSAPENHYFKLYVNSTLDASGNLTGEFTVEAEGQSDGTVRRVFTSGFMDDWKSSLEKELFNISPQAQLISVDYGKDPRNYQAAPIKIKTRFFIPEYATVGNGVFILKPVVFSNLYSGVRSFLRINTSLEERKYSFKDACSRLIILDETMNLPTGYQMVQASRADEKQSNVADFSGSLKQEGNQLLIHQNLALKKRVYEAKDWPDFRSTVNAYKSFAHENLIFKTK